MKQFVSKLNALCMTNNPIKHFTSTRLHIHRCVLFFISWSVLRTFIISHPSSALYEHSVFVQGWHSIYSSKISKKMFRILWLNQLCIHSIRSKSSSIITHLARYSISCICVSERVRFTSFKLRLRVSFVWLVIGFP